MAGRRFRYWTIGLTGAGALLVGTAVALVLSTGPAPGGSAARVTACEVTGGLAQVGYAVTNRDGVEHGYRVLVTVVTGSTPLGWGQSQVNRVAPGQTATARVPVTVKGTVTHPTCTVHAEVNDGRSGHHGA